MKESLEWLKGLSYMSPHLLLGAGAIEHHFRQNQSEGRNAGPHTCVGPILHKVGTSRFPQISLKLCISASGGIKREKSLNSRNPHTE